MHDFASNTWHAKWWTKPLPGTTNPYNGGDPYNDPFPFSQDIDGGTAYFDPPVFIIDGGAP